MPFMRNSASSKPVPDPTLHLRRQLRFFQAVSAACGIIALIMLTNAVTLYINEHALDLGIMAIDPKAPHAEEVREIIKPLSYSGFEIIMRPDFSLSIDLE